MSFGPGTRLGPYEITAQIGVGGMGEVYRATDTNLKRAVAIKVIPEAVAADVDRLARFQREAEVLASLNHPNIAQVHGLQKSDGATALVMELVEGPTLAERIAEGPLSLDDALHVAKQIAEALEAAHERVIIHRDLKPANIKLRSDGTVKVLDFGLAKVMEPPGTTSSGVSQSPTITTPAMTQAGVILGTAAYMSPEQARGKPVDKRADIWAFGCVLYEMVTGKRAFPGEDVSETLATVIKGEPDWNRLPANTRGGVRRLLRRCLQKDVNERLHDISDARIEIEEAQATIDPDVTIVAAPAPVHGRERVVWTLLAIATLMVVALAVPATLYVRRTVPEPPAVTRLDVVTPATSDAFSFALSRDGRQLVFVANGEKGQQLWVRPLDQTTAQPLASTEGATYPFWAPDGRAVGFFADGKLKRISLTGGAVQVLADAPLPRGGSWNAEGVIVFSPNAGSAVMRVAATGGDVAPVTQLGSGQGSHRWPQFLPDGRRFLFSMATGLPHTQGAYIGSLDRDDPMLVLPAETAVLYAAPGYLLLVSQGLLLAYPFDTASGTVGNEAIPVAQGVGTDDGAFHSAFSVSERGVLAHRAGAGSRRQLAWFNRSGELMGAIGSPDENGWANPELAADSRRIALNRTVQGNVDVWLLETGRGVPTRFTFDAGLDSGAIWSPDGGQIVFRSTRKGSYDLFHKPASGTVEEQPLLITPENKTALDWSPDGRFLLYSAQNPKTASDIWALPMVSERKPFAVVQSSFDEIEGQFSPDGQWIAYSSNESGRYEIYIRAFPKVGEKWQVSASGGMQPRWQRDGRELFYVAPDTRLMAVTLRLTPNALEASTPVALFPARLASGGNIPIAGFQARAQYAVASDGRFLLNTASDGGITSPITIVQNWTAALETR
jgi:hypothetical protein